MRGAVTVHVAAPAGRCWDLVTDISRIGEFRSVNTWRYVLGPRADGTDITESFELTDMLATRVYWLLAGRARRRTNVNGMRVTLEKIKAAAETDP
ncbi:MAG: hypothetical protein ACRDND_00235 [Streptosporangiaceae bacterium]